MRKRAIVSTILLFLASALIFSSHAWATCTAPGNAIEAENCLSGTPQSTWDISGAGDSSIQGFAADISVNVGQTINFKINTNATSYHLDIYRMGYYQGNGARKVATVTPSVTLPQSQPNCLTDAATGLYDCGNWKVSASWSVPSTAMSGIYFARVIRDDTGGASHIVFIVRNDASHSDILFQAADTSWQAYNDEGGQNLYGCNGAFNLACRAFKVSYNRPFHTRAFQQESLTWVFNAEYAMVRWLEANGYDVTYFTDTDTDRNGALILNHKLWMSNGHDEYWSGNQRANIEAARNAGVHLAFFSGNTMFWKIRWENSTDGSNTPYRTLVCYKETANDVSDPLDPPTWTGTWRDPRYSPPADGGRPENAVKGNIFRMNGGQSATMTVPAADGKMRFWRNTTVANLSSGSASLAPGTIGAEFDDDEDNGFRPAGLFELSATSVTDSSNYLLDYGVTYGSGTAVNKVVMYRASSGALVFSTGTYNWSWGLDSHHDDSNLGSTTNAAMKQATVNLFADMGIQSVSLQSGLLAATASTDKVPPASTITSPTPGAIIASGTKVTIQGTAADTGGGVVAGVEVSTDNGATWHPASGRASWTYTWTASGSGTTSIRSRAVDDSGNLETPSAGVTVNVGAGTQTCPCTIFGNAVPAVPDQGPDASVNLGLRFKSDVAGFITGTRFYKSAANTGTHVGNLWSSTGTLLATATFTNETASGWQTVNFATPVAITAGTYYVASYFSTIGHYAEDDKFFTAAYDDAPLHAAQDGIPGANGVYIYSSTSAFPNQAWSSANYWVDVVFSSSTGSTYSMSGTISGAGGGATVTLSGTASATATADASGNYTFTGLANGPYTVTPGKTGFSFTPASQAVTVNNANVTAVNFSAVTYSISGTISGAGGNAATVTLSGTANATVTADASGNYSFAGLVNGPYTVTPSRSGFTFTPTNQAVTVSSANLTGVNFDALSPIPHTLWSLVYVDSQETSCENGAAANAIDGNPSTKWVTQWCPTSPPAPHEIQINLGGVYSLTAFQYLARQDGCANGWIKQYEFYVSTDGVNWGTAVATGTFNYGALSTKCPGGGVPSALQVPFPATTGQYIRLRALSEINGNPWTAVAEINVIGVLTTALPPAVAQVSLNPAVVTGGNPSTGTVTLTTAAPSGGALVTLSSSDASAGVPANVTVNAGTRTANFNITTASVSSSTSVSIGASLNGSKSATLMVNPVLVSQTGWSVVYVDSQEASCENGAAANAIDGNPSTKWVTQWCPSSLPAPHEIQINLGGVYSLTAFQYLARQDGCANGWIKQYEFYVSTDGVNWGTAVATGTFNYGALSTKCPGGGVPSALQVPFPATTGQYIRLRALSEINGNPWTAVAEINVIGVSTTAPPPAVSQVTLNPAVVTGGNPSTGTVTLTTAAPSGGALVTLSSGDASAGVPANVTVNPGATTATFTITTTSVSSSTSVSIGATLNGNKSATLTVNPVLVGLNLVSDGGNNRVLIYNAPFSSDQSANVVLGQAGFTTATAALTAAGMNGPVNAVEDGAGNIYVSDQLNNRVLQFKPPFSNGMSASLVIGQPDFVTGTPNATQNGLNAPGGLAFDSSGNLWVVDFNNNRILQYKPPFANNMNASLVIGQAGFTTAVPATTNSGLTNPVAIAFDASGNLWVTDNGNNRVLEFKPSFANGMAASLVIGQPDFVSRGAAATASALNFPTGIAFDSTGNLWIGDTLNNRVLQFRPAFTTGMSASLVLGQASFIASTAATTQSGFSSPFGVAFDNSGNLLVADSGNNRTLEFAPPFSNNQSASLVLGQANFTSAAAATTATGQNTPFTAGAAFLRFNLVSDGGNNRVLIYNAPFSSDQSANVVLGQAVFTTATAALTAAGMNGPVDAVEDGAGNIYVSDQLNNRVLQFKPPFSNGMSASLVIGQPDFVTGAPNATQNSLNAPGGLAFDSSGNLWVVDFNNNRILQYKPPFANNMNASLVIGQAGFTTAVPATTNSGLTNPVAIAFDASGNLWVTDNGNNRVLEFKPSFANGMAASLVIGQPDFVSRGAAATASALNFPTGIAFDSTGNLWIGDTLNNRVLQFRPAFTTGMSASLVLGQASFIASTAATTQSGFSSPFGVAFDNSGNLLVADSGNNRTLEFAPPFSNNQSASLVLGQANFTSAAAATTATGQNSPFTAF